MKIPILLSTFLLVLLTMSLSACWRDNSNGSHPGFIAGHVYEFGTNQPIVGSRVKAYGCEGEVLGSLACGVLDSADSNAEGYYRIDDINDDDVLVVNAFKEGYFTDDFSQAVMLDGKEDKTDVTLHPYAWLSVTIRNESGAYQITAPGYDYQSNGQSFYLTQGADSTFTLFRKGNQDLKYLFSVISQEGGPSTMDLNAFKIYREDGQQITPSLENSAAPWFKIYLPGHDTTTLLITY